MNNTLVIAIDPGDKYVGIFSYWINDTINFTIHQIEITDEFMKSIQHISNTLDSIIKRFRISCNLNAPQHIIAILEDYVNYTHKTSIKGFKKNLTSEMLGWLKQYFSNHCIPYCLQKASQAKSWDNDRLIRLDLMREVNGRYYINNVPIPKHTRDAYRHFIYYTNKNWFNNCINRKKVFND